MFSGYFFVIIVVVVVVYGVYLIAIATSVLAIVYDAVVDIMYGVIFIFGVGTFFVGAGTVDVFVVCCCCCYLL